MGGRSIRVAILALMLAAGAARAGGPPEFPKLLWSVDKRVPDALRVFPAPADPAVAFVSSARGLWRTTDDAATWQLIPRTRPGVMGTISHLAVCPLRPSFVVLASLEKGVFLSADRGTTWRPGGGVQAGLAGPSVVHVTFPREDRAWQTLLACHGERHVGLSRSIDGGLSWRVISPKRHFRHVLSLGMALCASSSTRDEPDRWMIVSSQNYGENWRPVHRQAEGTVACETATRRKWRGPRNSEFFGWREDALWGPREGRLLLSQDVEEKYIEVGPRRGGRWASVFVTPAADCEQEWLWAYDPYREGLICVNSLAPRGAWRPNNYGLLVTRMIRRGGNAAANAQGTTFYACVNHSLHVGRHADNEEGPTIRLARATPAVVILPPRVTDKAYEALARSRRDKKPPPDRLDELMGLPPKPKKPPKPVPWQRVLDVTVRVSHRRGPNAVKAVQVVPDLLGLPTVKLYDDGVHGDGRGGDGVWGGRLLIRRIPGFGGGKDIRRRPLPGIRGIPVRAMDNDGKTASWTLVFGADFEPGPFVMWNGDQAWGARSLLNHGQATIASVKDPGGKTRHVQVKGRKGPWTMCWADASGRFDITGLKYVGFQLKGSRGAGDVSFCLVDGLDRASMGVTGPIEPNFASRFLPLVKGKYLPAMDGKVHVVRIPVEKLTRDIRFMRMCVAGFGLRAEAGAGAGTYDFGRVWFEN